MSIEDSEITKRSIKVTAARAGAVALHVFLLVSAFPPFAHSESAWFALVPLILLARFTGSLRQSFRWGWLAGAFFWLLNLAWLLRLGVTGGSWLAAGAAWIGLSFYCALYTGVFSMLTSHLFNAWGTLEAAEEKTAMGGTKAQLSILIALPLLWAGLEYLRGTLFTGFPWNGLGVSQFRNEGLVQLASFGGGCFVSSVVVLANTGLAFTVLRFVDMMMRRRGPRFNLPLMLGLGGAMLLWFLGVSLGRAWIAGNSTEDVRIAALQPAIPQTEKWEPGQEIEIFEVLNRVNSMAAALGPEIIIWPETACPEIVSAQQGVAAGMPAVLASAGVPILAGVIEYELAGGRTNYYNSSIYYSPGGGIEGVYRKMHLVPFGEYIPGESIFPSLAKMAPLGFSCGAGTEMTVFKCGSREIPFSALICFEDVFPSLSRKAVRRGARFLVNQTNDAWFDGSSASVQHLANAVFRCTENRVSMVRCANTGVSCFINPLGQIDEATKELLNRSGRYVPEESSRMGSAEMASEWRPTFYSKYGDLGFGLPCAIGVLAVFALAVASLYRKNTPKPSGDVK
jgi:apolipoprotein N-acyltransferase